MKIVCITASTVPSSAANSIQVMKACQALAQLGHNVHLLAPGAWGAKSPAESWERLAAFYGLQTPFEVEWMPSQAYLKRYDFSWSAVSRARALGAQALYVWLPQAAVFGLLQQLPVLLEMHGEPEGKLGPWLFRLYLYLQGRKRLLPITQALVRLLEGKYGYTFTPGEAVVSPNGVDLERYQNLPAPADARAKLGLPEGLTAGYTGHLYPGRGMELLEELARRFPAVQFLWVGGQPGDVQAWKQRLKDAGLQNVNLVGFVENSKLPLYQAAADVLLMPYERKIAGSGGGNSAAYASPMKMFEYMAVGRAIITSDLPVIREVLSPRNAVFCPPEEPDAWAQALQALLEDPSRRADLGGQAWKDVQTYTWQERGARALDGFIPGVSGEQPR